MSPAADRKPLVIYDGDCGFCEYWARYWQRASEGRIALAPYQQVHQDFPGISVQEFRAAVQYIAPDGSVSRAAQASFRAIAQAPGKGFWLWLYRRVAPFAWASERAYRLIAAHRELAFTVSRLLWGRELAPPRHELVTAVFLRGLGLIFLAAFVSLGVQVVGLVGSQGISPAGEYLDHIAHIVGAARFWQVPTLFWLGASDWMLQGACWLGAACALRVVVNPFQRGALALCYALYLSLFHVGQEFLSFQWDMLLIEAGFLGLLLTTGSRIALWLGRWLVFRFFFLSGVVKIMSGDPSWTDFTALGFHFETQPLPTPLAWHAHHAPAALLSFSTGATLAIELGLPFLIFLPRRLRHLAALGFALLQLAILLTGNYNFFNLLALALCLLLLDDAALYALAKRVFPQRVVECFGRAPRTTPTRATRTVVAAFAVIALVVGSGQIYASLTHATPPRAMAVLTHIIAPFGVVSAYGPFAVMTKERPEIVIEGSDDGLTWREYGFRHKPHDVARRPGWNIPHQPRLDWQMWFAALSTQEREPWFGRLMQRLLEGSPSVLALFETIPFPDRPPRFVRALLYDYRFTSAAQRRANGHWWIRQPLGAYFPVVALRESTLPADPRRPHGLSESILQPRQ
jgi:predicted DCC family thiol-disulfide oxidoreductase YuxK